MADFRPERADLGPERTGFRPERANVRPERADSRPKRADFRPERADFRPERADFRPERALGGTHGRTNGRTKVPLCSTGLHPLRGRCPKSAITSPKCHHLINF